MLPLNNKHRGLSNTEAGVTLVELIIAIVIISIASVALLQGLGFQTSRNVDPMIQSQAQMLARQYLQEVQAKSFFDPAADPRTNKTLSKAAAITSINDQSARTAAPTDRRSWDNLYEYHNLRIEPRSQDGSVIDNLTSFSVFISLDSSLATTLGTLSNMAGCPPQIILINVTVTDPRGQDTNLSGYRTSLLNPPASWGC